MTTSDKALTNAARTFVALKPDTPKYGQMGEIITRFEEHGNLQIVKMEMRIVTREFAKVHYDALKDEPFFEELLDYLTSGCVIAMVIEGPEDVVEIVREMIGATDPQKAKAGTIRGDLAQSVKENRIHGSDSAKSADSEIKLWFPDWFLEGSL